MATFNEHIENGQVVVDVDDIHEVTISAESGVTLTNVKCIKDGRRVTLYGGANKTAKFTKNVWNTIGTLPTEARPQSDVTGNADSWVVNGETSICSLQITTGGLIQIAPWASGNTTNSVFNVSYYV